MTDRISKDDMRDAIDAARDRLDDLERMVDTIPGNGAKMDGADGMGFGVGDTFEGIISDDGTGTKHGDPLTHTDGVVTFLNSEADVEPGDTVRYVIASKDDTHAKGVVTDVNPDD